MEQTTLNLYITHLDKEGPFLKIWGQTEKQNSIYVEQFLLGASQQFELGAGKVPPESLLNGTLICAKYKDNKYYRARLIDNSFMNEGFVEVTFLDYGNRDMVPCSNIRSLQNFPSSFISIPPLAACFIFAEAHCIGGGEWNDTVFDVISKEIKYQEFQCTLVGQATQYYLVKLIADGTDLCDLLLQRRLMQPVSMAAQQAVILSMSLQKPNPIVAPQPPPSSSTGLNTYKACTLEPGCLYPVYVSYVNDGPCHFSVQLKQSEEVLSMLMTDINSITLRPLEDIPIPGTICLARCQEDGNICRAVVTNEVDNQFKVFYVDFGNYEIVPLDALYQIPFKYVLPKVMAIRFALAGIEKSSVTMEMQCAFKTFVDNRLLHMKVLPTPTRMAIPKCELWDAETKTSALDVINRAARHAYPEPISLNRGFSQLIKVSFVYSCNRFYVQLVSKESELVKLMLDLQETCLNSDAMEPSSIKEGLPCCALFESDQQWYRCQIVEILGDDVKVRYIDYGNEEIVRNTQLKVIDGEQLTVLRPQAIECCLNGYQNMEVDAERDGLLEEIILESNFNMKVVEMLGKKALVDLFDTSNYNVASLLLDKLAAAKSQISPVLAVQAGNKIEHRKSSVPHQQQNGPTRQDRRPGRENSNWNNKPNENNERYEKPWRQENKDFRSHDNNTNENSNERPSWRDNNKGFSPKHKKSDCREKSHDSNDNWNNAKTSPSNNWDQENTNDDWNASPPQDNNPRENNFNRNKGRFDSDTGGYSGKPRDGGYAGKSRDRDGGYAGKSRDNDGGYAGKPKDRDGGYPGKPRDRDGGYAGKPRDRDEGYAGKHRDRDGGYAGKPSDGGYRKKQDFRKDGSELSSSGSEKSFKKGPRTSSRNDRGGSHGRYNKPYDKPAKNNNSFNTQSSPVEDSWNVSAVTTSQDLAPVTATFKSYDLIGTEAQTVISWFHNPGHFFCQLVDSQETFKTLMEDIQKAYKTIKPSACVVGAPVIALFPEDNVLYRAQVLQLLGSQYKVYYVDFGNVSTVTKVWPIENKFMDLPAQAIACAMNNLKPFGAEWLDADSFSSYFEKDRFTCRFINKDEEKTYVDIFYENEDIAQLLIRDSLAISTQPNVTNVEIPLLLGQQFRAVIKSVNNLADIIIALECGLALSCSMHNLETATETFDDDLRNLLEQTVIVYVDNVIDNKLEVTLYDLDGNKYTIINPDEGAFDTIEPSICPLLVLSSTITGYVSHVNDNTIYIQPDNYADCVGILLDQMFEHYDSKQLESPIIPEEEQIYAVHSSDANWYRGKVLGFDDEKAKICYIDYGNTEDVEFKELRELEVQFKEMCALSLPVHMDSPSEHLSDKSITLNVFYGDNGWEGTIIQQADEQQEQPALPETTTAEDSHEGTTPIITEDTGIQSASNPENEDEYDFNEDNNMDKSKQKGIEVFVSHVDTPDDFYVQLSSAMFDIENLQATLQQEINQMPVLENPAAGILCAAPYSGDGAWYRAEILDADDDITTVRFVDFGNTDVIDNKTTQVKTLPPHLLSLAVYATRCSLNIKSLDEEWSTNSMDRFQQLAGADKIAAVFLDQDERANFIELFSDGNSVKEILIQENLAAPVTQTTENRSTGFVSHFNSPSEFWIQMEICVDELEWIAEQLSTAESFPELEDMTPGTLCAALFPDDEMWYRARILSNTVAGIELLFIDYGNSCSSGSLRQLPEELVVTPPLAQKCSLQKPDGIPSWTTQMCQKFQEISADGQTIFTVRKLSTGETSIVQLLLDGEDVAQMLLPNTEECHLKNIESLENMIIEKEDGEQLPNTYALENLSGTSWTADSIAKLDELNAEGATRFQVEFLDGNNVRLYLNGEDIRLMLAPSKITHVNVTSPTKSIDIKNDNVVTESSIDTKETDVVIDQFQDNAIDSSKDQEMTQDAISIDTTGTDVVIDHFQDKVSNTSKNKDEEIEDEVSLNDKIATDIVVDHVEDIDADTSKTVDEDVPAEVLSNDTNQTDVVSDNLQDKAANTSKSEDIDVPTEVSLDDTNETNVIDHLQNKAAETSKSEDVNIPDEVSSNDTNQTDVSDILHDKNANISKSEDIDVPTEVYLDDTTRTDEVIDHVQDKVADTSKSEDVPAGVSSNDVSDNLQEKTANTSKSEDIDASAEVSLDDTTRTDEVIDHVQDKVADTSKIEDEDVQAEITLNDNNNVDEFLDQPQDKAGDTSNIEDKDVKAEVSLNITNQGDVVVIDQLQDDKANNKDIKVTDEVSSNSTTAADVIIESAQGNIIDSTNKEPTDEKKSNVNVKSLSNETADEKTNDSEAKANIETIKNVKKEEHSDLKSDYRADTEGSASGNDNKSPSKSSTVEPQREKMIEKKDTDANEKDSEIMESSDSNVDQSKTELAAKRSSTTE